jgi:DNA ligase (NAD+)
MSQTRINYLENKIFAARDAYYNTDTPIMSDREFDALIDELRVLNPNSKAVTMIGYSLRPTEWKKAKHQIPMGSLDKVNTPDDLLKWTQNILELNNSLLFVSEKLDGISINCVYENGRLTQAITRGSEGIEGEDITSNVILMSGVHCILNTCFTGSLRGEIIMKKSVHQKYFADKANPRNAASGLSKRLDGIGVECLNVFFYQAIGDVEFETENEQLQWLINLGVSTPNYWIFNNADEANNHWKYYQNNERKKLDYDIDGLVVRIDNLSVQIACGEKDMRPKGAVAFKFDNETRESIIRDVIWQVGSSGRLTPVAIIDPIILCGVEVKRASLHNVKRVKELDLYIGCKVLVSRRNDVIPYIEEKIS